jgi:glycosyltransferase involved in cell wall biosynthesis
VTTVSIIIPARSTVQDVARAVTSAQEQTSPADEIVIVDDASDEPLTAEAVGLLPNRGFVMRFEKNRGPSAARNAGIAASSGDLIAFLDSDDTWRPEKLERQRSALERAPHLAAISCGWDTTTEMGAIGRRRVPIASSDPMDFVSGCWFCPGSTILMRRAAFEKVGPFDESLRRLEDVDWYIRFALHGGSVEVVQHVDAVISIGRKRYYAEVAAARNAILAKRYATIGSGWSERHRQLLNAYLDLELASAAWKEGRWTLTATHLARSLVAAPRTSLPLRDWWREEKTDGTAPSFLR